MEQKRSRGPFLVSVAVHVVVGIVIANAAFHYGYAPFAGPKPPPPQAEKVTYFGVAPAGIVGGADSASAPPKSTTPIRGLVAPVSTPTVVAPAGPPVGGTPDGVAGGRMPAGAAQVTTGIVPGTPDPRLSHDARAFFPEPKTHAERVDSAVKASIYAYSDSVARAMAAAGRKPGDWTFDKNGQKWGIDGNKIYLGKFAIPSAVLAALPIRIQGNPGEGLSDRLAPSRRADLLVHAASQYQDAEFKSAVKRIRERKDKERAEKQAADSPKPIASNP